jgi:hypothetical protein
LIDLDLKTGGHHPQNVRVAVRRYFAAGGALPQDWAEVRCALSSVRPPGDLPCSYRPWQRNGCCPLPTPSIPVNRRAWGMVPWVERVSSRIGRS